MGLADIRYRRLGRRLVYFERPDLIPADDRAAFEAEVARRVRGGEGVFEWLTLPQAYSELEELIASTPEPGLGRLLLLEHEMRELQR